MIGCGESQLAPAGGTTHINGLPAVAGRVVFRPLTDGKTAIGTIERDGTFVMKVGARQKGAQIGENHVLVIDARTGVQHTPVSFRAPATGRVVVRAKEQNNFLIDVSEKGGWSRIED
jgi:hypothetical protein